MASFVPSTERIPGVYQRVVLQREAGLRSLSKSVCLIGWRTTAAGDTYDYQPQRVRTRTEVQALAGVGSQLDLMARAAFNCAPLARQDAEIGILPEIWIMPVPPPSEIGDVVATQTMTFGGAATTSGTIPVYAGFETVLVRVNAGDSPTTIAAAVDAALQTVEGNLPFTHAPAAGVVTATAREKGLWGESYVFHADIREIAGITVTVANGATGVGVIDLSTALDAARSRDFTVVVLNQDDAATTTALPPHVETSWSYDYRRYAAYVVPAAGDWADAQTVAAALDDWRTGTTSGEQVTGVGAPFSFKDSSRSFPFEHAAAYGTRLLTHTRANYNYNLATLPTHGRPLTADRANINDAINAGVTVIMAPERGNAPGQILDPVSTAITDQTGATTTPDLTWAPIEIALTVAEITRQMELVLASFAQLDASEETLFDGKAEALKLLRAAADDKLITGITDDSAVASFATVGGSTDLVIDLDYDVVVGVDRVAVTHNVRRAV